MKTVKGTTPSNVSGLQVLVNRRCTMNGWRLVWIVGLLNPAFASAIMLGQVDDFQDGTNQGWEGYTHTTNVATGGPAGAGDRYWGAATVRPDALGAANTSQWAGDYVTARVTAIEVDLMNSGTSDLEIRLFFSGGNHGRFASNEAFPLPADGQWYRAAFGLTSADLTWVGGGNGDLASALHYVDPVVFHHQAGAPVYLPTPVLGSLGIDNVRAVPEPAMLAFAGVTILGMLRRKRR